MPTTPAQDAALIAAFKTWVAASVPAGVQGPPGIQGPPGPAGGLVDPPPPVVGNGYPGQAGNPVGHTAASGHPGSLTTWPGGTGYKIISDGTFASSGSGTASDPWVFKFYDFDGMTGGTLITASHVRFIGCRFQSNSLFNYNVQTTGVDIAISYCSIVPRTSKALVVPHAAWPCAGAGLQICKANANYAPYQIGGNDGYQYGVNIVAGGPVTIDHCDIWGFGNSIVFYSTTAQMRVTDNWIHDCANADAQSYHTDGPGYLNGGTPPQNILIDHNTICSIGNATAANGIAFQYATSPYGKIIVTNNYMSGFGYLVNMCHNVAGSTNLTFTDNVISTDAPWLFGPIYANFSTMFKATSNPTNLWRRNTFKFISGAAPVSGQVFNFSPADQGKFILPDQTLSTNDWAL